MEGARMKAYVIAFAIAAVAALGGDLAVFSEYDDAPGGVLIGGFLVIAAAVAGARIMNRRATALDSEPRPARPGSHGVQ